MGRSRAAQAATAQGCKLDQAFEKGETASERRRLLDSAISEGTKQRDQALGVNVPRPVGGGRTRQGQLQPVRQLHAGGKTLSLQEFTDLAAKRTQARGESAGNGEAVGRSIEELLDAGYDFTE